MSTPNHSRSTSPVTRRMQREREKQIILDMTDSNGSRKNDFFILFYLYYLFIYI